MAIKDIRCKHCGSSNVRLAGRVNSGNQRYKCRDCTRTFTITNRKYSVDFKLDVIKLYLNKHGIRNIERTMNVNSRMINYWIKQFARIMKEKLSNLDIPQNLEDVEIIEVSEEHPLDSKNLLTSIGQTTNLTRNGVDGDSEEVVGDIKKDLRNSRYGVLLTENKIRLLISK